MSLICCYILISNRCPRLKNMMDERLDSSLEQDERKTFIFILIYFSVIICSWWFYYAFQCLRDCLFIDEVTKMSIGQRCLLTLYLRTSAFWEALFCLEYHVQIDLIILLLLKSNSHTRNLLELTTHTNNFADDFMKCFLSFYKKYLRACEQID